MTVKEKPLWSGRHSGKDVLRSRILSALFESTATLKDPTGHIPPFIGAERAALKLAVLPIWTQASVIRCNPDSTKLLVRVQAIKDGEILYMAVSRLTDIQCFIEFDPQNIPTGSLGAMLSASRAIQYGKLVSFEEMEPIDLVVTGCVAVTRPDGRMGKGAGFADLELGMLRDINIINQIGRLEHRIRKPDQWKNQLITTAN